MVTMSVVKKVIKGKEYWRVRISKRPERHLYFPISTPKEEARRYGDLARRYIRGELEDLHEYPELFVKLKQVGLAPNNDLLSIGEAAEYLHVSYTVISTLSLGAMFPIKFEIINGRRYFDRNELVRWAHEYREKASRNPWAWAEIPDGYSEK